MCVAAIIHKPVTLKHLKCMDEENPHGGGVAWMYNGKLHFRRGLHADAIFELQRTKLTFPYLLHFRWATHGPRIPQLTHPFPTGARAFAGELKGVANEVIIHNGVWNHYDDFVDLIGTEVPRWALKDTSDTAIAAYFYAEFPELGDEIPWAVASARIEADKLVIRKHGGWSEHEGNEFSNLNWLPWDESGKWGGQWYRRSAQRGNFTEEGGWTWTTKSPGGQEWSDWDEYLNARYGIETASAAKEVADSPDDADLMAKMANQEMERELRDVLGDDSDGYSMLDTNEIPELPDDDMISDDPATVNKWLAKRAVKSFLVRKPYKHMDSFMKCACGVWTDNEGGVCRQCCAVDNFIQRQQDPRGAA